MFVFVYVYVCVMGRCVSFGISLLWTRLTSTCPDVQVHEEFMRMDDEQGRSVDQVIEALRPSGISPHDVQ